MKENSPIVVIGAGIAGCSVAWALARRGARVTILEREVVAPYHSTARSAALGSASYGPLPLRDFTVPSLTFYRSPPSGFTETSLVAPRGVVHVARSDQADVLRDMWEEGKDSAAPVELLNRRETLAKVPALAPNYAVGSLYEPEAVDLNVGEIYEGFRRRFRDLGGEIVLEAGVVALERRGGWAVETTQGRYYADIVVNAAGAWAGAIGQMAGAFPCGFVPKRRTVVIGSAAGEMPDITLPFTFDIEEKWYFRVERTGLLMSPADETPMSPCDVQPDELDVAHAIARVERATNLRIGKVVNKWAGLRTFVADKLPVVGFDPLCDDFFWLAGQGGYGIQTAPALAEFSACLVLGKTLPKELQHLECHTHSLSPERLVGGQSMAAE